MRASYDSLSPAAMLAYAAVSMLDPVDPLIVEVFAGVLLDKLRITEPPADLPMRDTWIQARNEIIASQADAIAEGFLSAVEVHSFNSSDLEVDWSSSPISGTQVRPMAEIKMPEIACPICGKEIRFLDQTPQHLANEHANKQAGYTLLECLPIRAIVINKLGHVYQKQNRRELCWIEAGNSDELSTWQLVRINSPIYLVVGESNA